ncbi:hypothetical protein VTO42DRAFT_4081 [Malbranchea cinnamomea]
MPGRAAGGTAEAAFHRGTGPPGRGGFLASGRARGIQTGTYHRHYWQRAAVRSPWWGWRTAAAAHYSLRYFDPRASHSAQRDFLPGAGAPSCPPRLRGRVLHHTASCPHPAARRAFRAFHPRRWPEASAAGVAVVVVVVVVVVVTAAAAAAC